MTSQILLTNGLRKALPVIDSINSTKFPLLLDRIALKLEENDFKFKPFSSEEEEKLVISLGVNKEDLKLLLESSVYIFEQAAFHMIKPTSLSRQLQSLDFSEQKSDEYAKAWGNHAKSIVERLRRSSTRNCELQDVSWSLNLQMASKVQAKQKLPQAMLAFHLSDISGPRNANVEFNHEELYQFYKKIDAIQSQLDALSDTDDNCQQAEKKFQNANNTDNKMKWLAFSEDSWGCTMDKSLRKNHMEYVIHGPNKAMEKSKLEEPVAMLPAALVDALIAGREKKIHDLENTISSVQEECEQTKLMYSAKLRIYWNLGKGRMEKTKWNYCKKSYRPSSAPNLQWGRRRQLTALLQSNSHGLQSWKDSQEALFSRRRTCLHGYCTALPPLKNDLEVQLWIWMEEVDVMESKLLAMESECNILKEELQHSLEDSKTLESQLNSLKINQAKEKMITLKMKDEIDRTSKCLDECKSKYVQAMSSKDEELYNLRMSLATQTEALGDLQATYCELKERTKFLENDKKEKEQLFMKLEILDEELKERQATLEGLMKDANQRAESLASAKETFNEEVERWKSKAKSIREEIARVEEERDDTLADITRLREEVEGLRSKCTTLEKEKLNKEAVTSLLLKDKKYLQAELTHIAEQLALTKVQFSEEVNARADIKSKMEEMNAKILFLEDELDQETQSCQVLEKEIQTMQFALETERKRFQGILVQTKATHELEMQEEKLKEKSLVDELDEERALKTKLQATLDNELSQKHDMEMQRNYSLLLQEKHRLEGHLGIEKSMRQELEMKMSALNEDLFSERKMLLKMKGLLNDEIAKSERTHQILRESMSEVLEKERLIKRLKDDLKEDNHLQINTLNKDLSTEREMSQKTKEMLKDEVAKNQKMNQLLSESMAEVLKKEQLIKSLKDDLIAKEDNHVQINNLNKDLLSVREMLQKTRDTLNDEVAKNQKTNQLLSESMAEVLKKEQLIKRLKDDLIVKEDNDLRSNAFSLSSESEVLQKTREMLKDEVAKNQKTNQLLSESMAEVLKKEQLIKRLKDDLTAKENNHLQINTLNKDLSTEQEMLQKTKEMLKDEVAKNQKRNQLLSESIAEVLKKDQLIKRLKDDLAAKENNDLRSNAFSLSSECEMLPKTRETLNDEIAKSERAHQLLSESMSEVLKKEHMIKSLKDDLTAKEKIILQLKCTHETPEAKKFKSKDFKKEIEAEGSKCEELTRQCNSLEQQLSKVKKHSDSLEENYTTVTHNLEMMVAGLKEKIKSENLKANQEAISKEILKRKMLELEIDLEAERVSCQVKVALNKELKEELQNLQHTWGLHEKKFKAMEEQHELDIGSLTKEVEDEQCRRLKAEGEVDENLRVMEKLKRQHEEGVEQLRVEFEQRLVESEERRALEEKDFREREEGLLKEKERLAEDLKYIVNQGGSGDGIRRQSHYSFGLEEDAMRVEARLKGVKSYHQRLLDEMCSRSIAREAAIQRAAEIEVTRSRREIVLVCHQLEAERCAHRAEKLRLENELKGPQSLFIGTVGGEVDSQRKDGHVDPPRPDATIEYGTEKGVAPQSPRQKKRTLKGMLTGNQGVPTIIIDNDKCKCSNVPKKTGKEVNISSHKNHSETNIRIMTKNVTLNPNKRGNEGIETAGNYRSKNFAIVAKGGTPLGNGPTKNVNKRKSPDFPSRDGVSMNIKQNIRATKSDGKFKTCEKEQHDSGKQILETNMLRYLNHVKNNSHNFGKLRATGRREGADCRKGFVASLYNSTVKNKILYSEAKPNLERYPCSPKNGMESDLSRGCVPPSEGPRMESNTKTKERVKPDAHKQKMGEKIIKSLNPMCKSSQDDKRKNNYPRHSSSTILSEVPTVKRRLKSN